MRLQELLDALPDYAKDTKLNFSSILTNFNLLTNKQFYGLLLATSIASRNNILIKSIYQLVKENIDENTIAAAKASASIMAMNNIYYRFTDLIASKEYLKMPAGLRMNVMRDSFGADKVDFELWSLGVSVINGCSMCISSHEEQLLKSGLTTQVIQFVAKVSAIVHAFAVTHETEQIMNTL
jgi:alkyl hydroperoxide reductase subunit D